jgi:hypothetical protein
VGDELNGLDLLPHIYHFGRQSRHPFAHHHPRRIVCPGPWALAVAFQAGRPSFFFSPWNVGKPKGEKRIHGTRASPECIPDRSPLIISLASFPLCLCQGATVSWQVSDQCRVTYHLQYPEYRTRSMGVSLFKPKERSKRLLAARRK